MTEYHILNLGAGVQSSTLYLMACKGEPDVPIELAIFADTGDEPQAVYKHLEWLESLGGPEIVRVSAGNLGDDLRDGRDGNKGRFASIPAFTLLPNGLDGKVRRQCSAEYKAQPIDQFVRREVLGLKPRQRIPKGVTAYRYFGFSFDETGRAERMTDQVRNTRFPLIDRVMRRGDCIRWVNENFAPPEELPRSACVYCPFHSNAEWRNVKSVKADWERAVQVDRMLREPDSVVNRDLDAQLFVHRSCVPLEDAHLGTETMDLFDQECEGGCTL